MRLTTPPWKIHVTKSEEAIGDTLLAEASEEGQGPRRAVEPMMMTLQG
jgi:hypothetical protein